MQQGRGCPDSQSIKTSGIIRDCRMHIVKGADHRYTRKEHNDEMLGAIREFVQEHFESKNE
jgi:dipeptidyl aminopeptidase/acylaminoacyl peptidase